MIRFVFNPKKTVQAAAQLLKLHNGRMPYMVLIKLLYLADRKALVKAGVPITGDAHFSMRHGPILTRVLDWINNGPDPNEAAPWFEAISEPDADKQVALKLGVPEPENLSRFELKVLKEVHDEFGHMDRWALVDHLHKILPEWQDPDFSSRPIEPEDILRAESKSDADIERISKEAHEQRFFSSLGSS